MSNADHPKGGMNGENNVRLVDKTEEVRPAEFSDDTLALRFTDEHLNDLRYVQKWGRWLRWDGKRWSFDETMHVFDMVRGTCRDQARRCNDPRVQGSTIQRQDGGGRSSIGTDGSTHGGDSGSVGCRSVAAQYARRCHRSAHWYEARCPTDRLRDQDDGGCTRRLMSDVPGVP